MIVIPENVILVCRVCHSDLFGIFLKEGFWTSQNDSKKKITDWMGISLFPSFRA